MLFNRFELKIGLRYLRAKQKNGFVSFIALVSIVGITLGVASLITVLSVMNGFQREIRNKIVDVTAHMQVVDISSRLNDWAQVANTIMHMRTLKGDIVGYAPYVDGQALLSFDGNVNGVLVRGIDYHYESTVDNLGNYITLGTIHSLLPKSFNIVIGKDLANQLGVSVGDLVTLVTPDGQVTPAGMIPRLRQFTVSGIFYAHMYEYDSSLALINLDDAKALFKLGNNNVSGIRLKVRDVFATPAIKKTLMQVMPTNIVVTDWIDEHRNYFLAVSLEKKMMFVILTLIVAVAAFNLVSTLVMTVSDKRADIAILRTMGASKRNIMKIFIIQGGVSGLLGSISGTALGVLLAYYIGHIVHFIELITGKQLINGDVYLINYLPSQIMPYDVLSIFVISLLLSVLATIYPSYKAAKLDPVEALRHE